MSSRAVLLLILIGVFAGACKEAPLAGIPSLSLRPLPREGLQWYRGNTHTHSLNSDGDTPALVVAEWYKARGYDFLVISDHNVRTDPGMLTSVVDSTFLLIAGEEVTVGVEGVPVHINGINIGRTVEWQRGSNQLHTLQLNIDGVRNSGGIAQINHPNLPPGLDTAALAAVRGVRLIEIHNAISATNNAGGDGRPSTTEIWDRLLTAGREFYGVASDDAHYWDYFHPLRANPGRAWVVVRAASLTPAAIVEGLETGNFYSSTGVALTDIVIERRGISIAIRADSGQTYQTRFIGARGELLAQTTANPARYRIRGYEAYVRAEVEDSRGRKAWVQPTFLSRR